MTRTAILLLGALALSTTASGQTAAETIERALAAAPGSARDGAAVVQWNADGSYEMIKEGTNRWVCWDLSGRFGFPAFAVTCTSIGSLESNAQFIGFLVEGAGNEEAEALRAAARADGSRVRPEYGSVQRMLGGPDEASAQPTVIVWVPGATSESIGIPDVAGSERALLGLAGTADAHILVSRP